MPGIFPIRIYVPEDRAPDGEALASEQTPQSVSPEVRAAALWTSATYFAEGVGAGFPRLGWALVLGCMIGLVWRGVQLVAALRRERPIIIRGQPLVVAVLLWAAVAAVVGLVRLSASCLPNLLPTAGEDGWLIAMVLALIVTVITSVLRHRRVDPEDLDE